MKNTKNKNDIFKGNEMKVRTMAGDRDVLKCQLIRIRLWEDQDEYDEYYEGEALLASLGTTGIAGNGYSKEYDELDFICLRDSYDGEWVTRDTRSRLDSDLVTGDYLILERLSPVIENENWHPHTNCGCI